MMICDKCKKNNATFHYRHNENGAVSEVHLCMSCANEHGFGDESVFSAPSEFIEKSLLDDLFGIGTIFTSMNEKYIGTSVLKSKVCPSCGLSEAELRKCGRLGCASCYSTFESLIGPILEKIHFSKEYKGEVPDKIKNSLSLSAKIEKLKRELNDAVNAQEYELAARLRDSIKQLESSEDK